MRHLRYSVAMSLDGFIGGPDGEYDWIVMDPTKDFSALSKDFDTLLMGRRTFELVSPARSGCHDAGHGDDRLFPNLKGR